MEIRKLTHHDAAAYWSLRLESLQTEPLAFGKSAEEHAATTVEGVAARLREMPPDFTLGAFEATPWSEWRRFSANVAEKIATRRIYGVYVQAAHRRKKIGHALIETLLQHVRGDSSIEQILISVTMRQEAARQLYRSFGFQSFGVELRALKVGSQYVDEEHMVLRLR